MRCDGEEARGERQEGIFGGGTIEEKIRVI